jgi:hypothetical protein
VSTRRFKRPVKCSGCKHHITMHTYGPKDSERGGISIPRKCGVKDCPCELFWLKGYGPLLQAPAS